MAKIIQDINPRTYEATRDMRNRSLEQLQVDDEGNIVLTLSKELSPEKEAQMRAVLEERFLSEGFKSIIIRYSTPNLQ